MKLAQRQSGVALITALVVVAFAAIIASDLLRQTFLDQRRTEAVLHGGQAHHYLRGAEEWSGHILRRDREETDADSLDQPWAQEMPPLPVEGGQIVGRLSDEQGLFNLNNLLDPDGRVDEAVFEQFQRLLGLLDIEPEVANAVVDWMDADQEPRFPGGAEDGHYLGLDPAYRTADQGIQSVSELRLIEGFRDPEVYRRIEAHVTALPSSLSTPINVNTASAPVLASLVEDMSVETAEQITQLQEEGGFESIEEFHAFFERNVPVPVDVRSQFFRLEARADIGSASVSMYSLVYRDESGASTALHRSYGSR